MDNTAFIINRECCSILDSLSHIVDVDIISKHFPSAAILGGNRCAGKTNVCSIWQAVPNNAGCANGSRDLKFSIFLFLGNHFFCQTILASMCFICHYHDVPALGKRLIAFLKFLHGGKDDAICLTVCQ